MKPPVMILEPDDVDHFHLQWGPSETCPKMCWRGSFLHTARQVSTVSPVALTIAFLVLPTGTQRETARVSERQLGWRLGYKSERTSYSSLKLTQLSDTTKVLNSHVPEFWTLVDRSHWIAPACQFEISGGTHPDCPACCESDGSSLHCLRDKIETKPKVHGQS